MHPAPSVILFTTFSGLGFGLLFWLGINPNPLRVGSRLSSLPSLISARWVVYWPQLFTLAIRSGR